LLGALRRLRSTVRLVLDPVADSIVRVRLFTYGVAAHHPEGVNNEEEVSRMAEVKEAAERRDALVERLSSNAIGAFDLFSVYLGDVLGLYRVLAEQGPLTSVELAAEARVHERYAREWLEQQAASALLDVDQDGDARRFRLPAGHDEALLDVSSLNYITPTAHSVLASIRPIDKLLEAFRNGGGVPYADYGDDMHESQAAGTRSLFENLLGKEWLPAIPELHERLLAEPAARVADAGCGQGRSSIAMARAYPKVRVDGIDADAPSIERAQVNLAGSGVEDRVTFHERDASDPELAGRYDLVTMFEALHDMSYPVQALRAARGLLAEGGLVLIADERTEDAFTAPASDRERLFYGYSVFHCLPVGMVGEGAAGTGTVMRADTLRHYAGEAGFSSCEVLPIEADTWRFYLLAP
jgi:2-polyprenyl-3-methyl-5-hydroxy-6-metoxy-1,4-benzoquinol methylase